MTWLAVVFAVASALVTALSTSVQHIAAGQAPESARGALGLLRHLLTRPLWLGGQALAVCGFVFHGLAMHNGPITLVQPIIICTIVFAVPVRAAFSRRLPGRREMSAVLLTAGALVAFLLVSRPQAGSRDEFGWGFLALVVLGLLVAYAGVYAARRVALPTRRGFVLGASAGILFGLVAVLLKTVSTQLGDEGLGALVTHWAALALLVAGLSGVAVNQLSYRTARLSASMPVLNVVDVVVALAFGYFVFQEVPRHDPVALLVEGLAMLALVYGLWTLSGYEAEAAEQDGAAGAEERASGGERQHRDHAPSS